MRVRASLQPAKGDVIRTCYFADRDPWAPSARADNRFPERAVPSYPNLFCSLWSSGADSGDASESASFARVRLGPGRAEQGRA